MHEEALPTVPVQSADLQDIHDVEPLSQADYECLSEVREILKKHGKRERFGVMLLHKHFDLDSDEILVEYTDVDERVQTIKPMKREEALANSVETSWMLADGDFRSMAACVQYCGKNVHGNHDSFHK